MKYSGKKYIAGMIVMLGLLSVLSGCGGGGGGSSSTALNNGLVLNLEIPRSAAQATSVTANIDLSSYDFTQTTNPAAVAQTSTTLTYNAANSAFEGTYSLAEIPIGTNYICVVALTYDTAAVRTANALTTATVGSLVDSIAASQLSNSTINATSTVSALATLIYARDNNVAMSDTATITEAVKDSIRTAANNMLLSGTVDANAIVYTANPFDTASWAAGSTLMSYMSAVLEEAQVVAASMPTVQSFDPAPGATNVDYFQPTFKVIFSESMDQTLDLTQQSNVDLLNFSISMTRVGGGSTIINTTNALYYGTFSWMTTNQVADTLAFTLKTQTQLQGFGLSTLQPSSTYSINSWSGDFTILTDIAGNPVDATNVPSTGTFSTIP